MRGMWAMQQACDDSGTFGNLWVRSGSEGKQTAREIQTGNKGRREESMRLSCRKPALIERRNTTENWHLMRRRSWCFCRSVGSRGSRGRGLFLLKRLCWSRAGLSSLCLSSSDSTLRSPSDLFLLDLIAGQFRSPWGARWPDDASPGWPLTPPTPQSCVGFTPSQMHKLWTQRRRRWSSLHTRRSAIQHQQLNLILCFFIYVYCICFLNFSFISCQLTETLCFWSLVENNKTFDILMAFIDILRNINQKNNWIRFNEETISYCLL